MDPLTVAIISKSLDGLTARAVATSENIANAGTPNYRPLRVTFEKALSAAAATGQKSAVEQVQPQLVQGALPGEDPDLRMDRELTTAATTAMRYAALIEILNRHMALHSSGAGGGA